MIIHDGEVLLDLYLEDNTYSNISFKELETLLSVYKTNLKEPLKPKEIRNIDRGHVCFSCDDDKHKFNCKIYKTCEGSDIWILLLMDDSEGYALYANPVTNKYELSWYRSDLSEPLSEDLEAKTITCYVPRTGK